MEDKERKRQMKAFFKSLKGTSQFDEAAYSKFNFSDSEDEAPPKAAAAPTVKAKANGSKEAGRPADAKQLGPAGLHEVMHTRVMFRSAAETAAAVRMVAKKGTRVQGTPYEISGNPWLLLSPETCKELKLEGGDAWVLMDGRNVGLGELVKPVQAEPASIPVEVAPEAKAAPTDPAHKQLKAAATDPSEKLVTMITLSVAGAASAACNGSYTFDGTNKGKALFKSSTGAIVFFNGIWKMSSTYKVSSCNYSAKGLQGEAGPLPPLGRWIAEGSGKLGPFVRSTGERLRVISEKGPQLKLEDGRTVTKSQENKVWCWASVLQEMETAADTQIEDLEKQKEKALKDAAKVEPPSKEDVKALSNPLWAFEQRAAQEAEATGEEMPSMEDLLDSIDHADEVDEAPGADSAAGAAAAVPSIDELMRALDQEEEEEASSSNADASRDLFFELGRRPTTAIMAHGGGAAAASWNAQLHGGVTAGRGADWNFSSFRAMGAAMAHEAQARNGES